MSQNACRQVEVGHRIVFGSRAAPCTDPSLSPLQKWHRSGRKQEKGCCICIFHHRELMLRGNAPLIGASSLEPPLFCAMQDEMINYWHGLRFKVPNAPLANYFADGSHRGVVIWSDMGQSMSPQGYVIVFLLLFLENLYEMNKM